MRGRVGALEMESLQNFHCRFRKHFATITLPETIASDVSSALFVVYSTTLTVAQNIVGTPLLVDQDNSTTSHC
jgi:hypothetical protein